jgi:hypothetical protein
MGTEAGILVGWRLVRYARPGGRPPYSGFVHKIAADVFKLNQKIPPSKVRELLLLNPQQVLPCAEVTVKSQALRDLVT